MDRRLFLRGLVAAPAVVAAVATDGPNKGQNGVQPARRLQALDACPSAGILGVRLNQCLKASPHALNRFALARKGFIAHFRPSPRNCVHAYFRKLRCARDRHVSADPFRESCAATRRRDSCRADIACGGPLLSVGLTVKPVGEPDAGERHVRFDERGWETERCRMAEATAPILDSTILLQKSFRTGDRKFCGLQARFSCKDVRDLVASR